VIVTDKANRFIAAVSVGCGWVGGGPAAAALVVGGYLVHEEDDFGEQDDFDALLAASSFGSEQARAIREQTPAAARERARRVLEGKEKCAPMEGDIDDAVGGLVYGLARGVVPGPTVLILDGCALTSEDLVTAWSGRGQADLKLVTLAACQTSVLWPDHRARLLQALIDHDAFAELRRDVAWKIVDWTLDVPRPPRVLRQCAALAVEQIDVSALACRWLAPVQGEAAGHSCRSCLDYLICRGFACFPDGNAEQEALPERSGGPGPTKRALNPAPVRAALTAGSTRPAIPVQTDTGGATRRTSRRVRAHIRRPRLVPRTARTRPSGRPRAKSLIGYGRLTCVVVSAAAVIAVAVTVAAAAPSAGFVSTSLGGTKVVIAATATVNEPAPALSTGIVQMLQSEGYASNWATTFVVDPVTEQPAAFSLTPYGDPFYVEYGSTRGQSLAADISAVQWTLGQEAASGPLDLLATLDSATRVTSPPATLIVLSSGLSTAGGFDLRQVGWDASPRSIAAQLSAGRLLPDLAGWSVVFSGLGDTAGRQPALPLPQQTKLTSYWDAICQASSAASCKIDDTTRPRLPSHVTTPAPVIPIPAVTSAQGRGATTASVPATLLFDSNSADLIPAADTVLRPLAQRARSQHLAVSITGYASGGSAAYSLALSARRANAVRNRLISLGLPAAQITKVTGDGTAGQSRDVCLVHGQPDEAVCAQLRRVVIVLSPAKANP
jgi:outer membrane protein OmpA-like peptidoglycan-associated protein